MLREQGAYDEAASALQDALNIARPALGSEHQLVAIYTINLASVQLARKEPAAAEALLREASADPPAVRPGSCRAVAARSPKTTGASPQPKSLLAKATTH